MYYFAYGSCMDEADLRRTTDAKLVAPAMLLNHRLAFTRYSKGRKGGVADIVPREGEYVEGLLFEITDRKALDRREGHPHIYGRVRKQVYCHYRDEWIEVFTYTVLRKSRYEYPPSDLYERLLMSGAANLSSEYRGKLKAEIDLLRSKNQEVPT